MARHLVNHWILIALALVATAASADTTTSGGYVLRGPFVKARDCPTYSINSYSCWLYSDANTMTDVLIDHDARIVAAEASLASHSATLSGVSSDGSGGIIVQGAFTSGTGGATRIGITPLTVTQLQALSDMVTWDMAYVSDGASASDCTVGGGTSAHWCHYTGSAWATDVGSLSVPVTVAQGGTGVTSLSCSTGQHLTSDGSAFSCSADSASGTGGATFSALSYADPLPWDVASSGLASAAVTLTGNSTLNASNMVAGGSYKLVVAQDGTGSRTLGLGAGCSWQVAGGGTGAVTLSSAAAAVDVLSWLYDGTNCYASVATNFTGLPVAATPTFDPAAGSYSSTQTVTIASTTAGATLCYTTDGTDPAAATPGTCSAGSTYSAPVSVSTSETVKALASKSGYANSAVASADYTISSGAITLTALGSADIPDTTTDAVATGIAGSAGETLFATFVDRDNSHTPTITSSPSLTWTAVYDNGYAIKTWKSTLAGAFSGSVTVSIGGVSTKALLSVYKATSYSGVAGGHLAQGDGTLPSDSLTSTASGSVIIFAGFASSYIGSGVAGTNLTVLHSFDGTDNQLWVARYNGATTSGTPYTAALTSPTPYGLWDTAIFEITP